MNILIGILATIGGFVVALFAYVLLFKRVEVENLSGQPDDESEYIDLEVVNLELGKALIAIHNLRMDVKNSENPESIEWAVELSKIHRTIEGVHNFIEGTETE